MLDKENQYSALYFPENKLALKESAYWALLDIDSNFSKLICDLLPSIKYVANEIKADNLNRLHFDFKIVATRKEPENEKETKEAKSKSKTT